MSKIKDPERPKASLDEIQATAHKIVDEILDQGLAQCTWRWNNEPAYDNLLKYREDMRLQAECILLKSKLEVKRGR